MVTFALMVIVLIGPALFQAQREHFKTYVALE